MSDLRRRYAVLRPTERVIAWTFIVFPIGLGGVLLLGDPMRVASPSFDALRATPGGVATWGFTWVALGVLLAYADVAPVNSARRHLFKAAGYLGITIVSFLFSFTWGLSAVWNPGAGLTGIPAYIGYAMLSSSIAVSHFALWRLKIDEPVTR